MRPQGKVCQAKAPLTISTVCRPKAAACQPPKTLQLDNDDAKAADPNSLKDLQEDEENEEVEEDFLMKVVDTKVMKVPKEELMIQARQAKCRRKRMELWDKQDRGVPDEEEQGEELSLIHISEPTRPY